MWMYTLLAMGFSTAAEARDLISAISDIRQDGAWVATEFAPLLCPTADRSLFGQDLIVPDAVLASARAEPDVLRRAEQLVAGAEVKEHRYGAFSLPNGGVRFAVVEVRGPDCVTWQPFVNPLDMASPVPAGRYTVAELRTALREGWAASASGPPVESFDMAGDVHRYWEVELDLEGSETSREVLVALAAALGASGARDPWWTLVYGRSQTARLLFSVTGPPVAPAPPPLPNCEPGPYAWIPHSRGECEK